MVKLKYLLALLAVWLLQQDNFAQQATPTHVLRFVSLNEKNGDKLAERTLQAAIDALNKSNRMDVLSMQNTNAAASHLLEGSSSYSVLTNECTIKKFSDSLQIVTFNYKYTIQGRVELLATAVETGLVAGRAVLVVNGETEKEFKLEYKKVGWAKGMNSADEKLRTALLDNAKSQFRSQLPAIYKAGQDAMVANMGSISRNAHYKLFPYRATVTEATEVKSDKAKTIKITAGTYNDLIRGDELIIYTVREIKSGEKVYEHFEILGRAAVEKLNEKDGLFDVEKGKKEILAALNEKKTLYASPEKPYTISKTLSGLNIAVAAFVTPSQFTKENKGNAYRRLRFNLMSKPGYNLLERENLSALNSEKELQKQEKFIDMALVAQFKAVGADLLLEVVCTEVVEKIEKNFDTGKVGSAKVSFDYMLRLVSVETGEVVGEKKVPFSKNYYHNVQEENPVIVQYNNSPSKDPRFFIEDALRSFSINPSEFLDEILPPTIIVSEVTDEKKDRADEVLVVGDFAFKSLDKWNVVRKKVINVEGKDLIRFESIGMVSLREAQGEGVANAKVKDGGEQILAAMRAGEVLYVMDKPNWAERWSSSYLYKHGY